MLLKLSQNGNVVSSSIRLMSSMVRGVPLSYTKVTGANNKSSTPLLIFHGLFGSKNNWRSLSKTLALRTGRDVYSFSLRNHGESPHVNGYQSNLNAMAQDIEYFINMANLEKVSLLGHSLGGRVGVQFAFNEPSKVDKLILVDITPLSHLPENNYTLESFFENLKAIVDELPTKTGLSQARSLVANRLMPLLDNDKFVVDFLLLSLYKDDRIRWRFNVDALRTLIVDGLVQKIQYTQPFTGDTLLVYGEKSNYVR